LYACLPHGHEFRVDDKRPESERDKPDCFLRDARTGRRFAVELTSVYASDRSVPDEHMPGFEEENGPLFEETPYDPAQIELYKSRLLEKAQEKQAKAKDYNLASCPLMLSVYVNDYCVIYISAEDWVQFIGADADKSRALTRFSEIVFWPFPAEDGAGPKVVSYIPSQHRVTIGECPT
jgi:hypothetical protein